MKTLIQEIKQRKNQIQILTDSKKSTLAELSKKSSSVGLNLHCQMVEQIAIDLINKSNSGDLMTFLDNVDVIFICDGHHRFENVIAQAFYKTLSRLCNSLPVIESTYNWTDYKGTNRLSIEINFDHYVKDDWGVTLSYQTSSTYSNKGKITNDSYEAYKSDDTFVSEGNKIHELDKVIKDAKSLQLFSLVKQGMINTILDSLKDLGHEQRDNDLVVRKTTDTFDDAINNIFNDINDVTDTYLSEMVGKSIDGGNVCSGLWKNQDENISNVYKLDIIKETSKCFRVNVHTCYKSWGYTDKNGEDIPSKKCFNMYYENILLPKGNIKSWLESITYGVENIDQVENVKKINKFKNLKSIRKIYDSRKVDKLYSNKKFQSLYDSLENMYVDISFSYMTDDLKIDLSRGCIWENMHSYNYRFEDAFRNYNPDVALVN